jgi:hypothetical protein
MGPEEVQKTSLSVSWRPKYSNMINPEEPQKAPKKTLDKSSGLVIWLTRLRGKSAFRLFRPQNSRLDLGGGTCL